MGRLLDEDDVVDWLLKRTEMYDATGHFVDENVVKKNIESQIAKIPSAQPEQHWIQCSSGKFPKESGTYTVTAYDGATNRVTYAKYQKRLKRWELTGARAYWRVLAWMPLPEPYAERTEE